jgi:hypothetical protein
MLTVQAVRILLELADLSICHILTVQAVRILLELADLSICHILTVQAGRILLELPGPEYLSYTHSSGCQDPVRVDRI